MTTARPGNRNRKRPAESAGWLLVALAALGCCSCQSGLGSSPATGNQAAMAPPHREPPVPSPAPSAGAHPMALALLPAHTQPQAGCPCCSRESDYRKFSAAYDQKHPAYSVQPAAYEAPCDSPALPSSPGVPTTAGLPATAWTGGPHEPYTHPTVHPAQFPYGVPAGVGAWAPEGVQRPWPYDEWIFDGGDKRPHVEVAPDWTVHGLQLEDTVAHFDTLDGRTLVEPANRVPLYAPRFAAVRKVYGAEAHHGRTPPLVHDLPQQVAIDREAQGAVDADQYLAMRTNLGVKSPLINLERDGVILVAARLSPAAFVNEFAPHENFQVIRAGIFDNSEKARLAQMVDAARVWTDKQAPEVIIDETQPLTAVAVSQPQVVVKYELAGQPRLRIVKVANRTEVLPGDVVDFTLRFDNIGSQTIGNVTIIDSLTTRLEYVPDTAQCSLRANFATEANYGESLVLRWEIIDPMKPGEGGVIRFRCRVR